MNTIRKKLLGDELKYEVYSPTGELLARVSDYKEASRFGKYVLDYCSEYNEPRFLIRDESGRGYVNEAALSELTEDESSYNPDESDEYSEPLGEWASRCDIGEEFYHDENEATYIRIR